MSVVKFFLQSKYFSFKNNAALIPINYVKFFPLNNAIYIFN